MPELSIEKTFEAKNYSIPKKNIELNLGRRIFDLSFSLLLILPFCLVILPVCGILIKISSPGPVFFIQKRTGANNSIFNCYKLRTMKVNELSETQQAIQNDQRITGIGYFLRVMHIDEMPQLFNVIKGEMSIIGPRPHMLHHTKIYSEALSYYHLRHQAKPGLTGLAQIKGHIGEIKSKCELRKRILNDIYYVRKASFKLNLFIILKTIGSLSKKLSYLIIK